MSFSRLNNLGLAEPDLQHKSSGSQVRVLPVHQGCSNCVLRNLLCGLLKEALQKSKTGMPNLIQNSLRKNKSLAFFFFFLFYVLRNWYISIWTRLIGEKKGKPLQLPYTQHCLKMVSQHWCGDNVSSLFFSSTNNWFNLFEKKKSQL